MAAKLFLAYHPADEHIKNDFKKYLTPLQLDAWDSGQVVAGEKTEETRKNHWKKAPLVLLLLSADFLADDKLWTEIQQFHQEFPRPIILLNGRPNSWQETWLRDYPILPNATQNLIKEQGQLDDLLAKKAAEQLKELVYGEEEKEEPVAVSPIPAPGSSIGPLSWGLMALVLFGIVLALWRLFYPSNIDQNPSLQESDNITLIAEEALLFRDTQRYNILLFPFRPGTSGKKMAVDTAIWDRLNFFTIAEKLPLESAIYGLEPMETVGLLDIDRLKTISRNHHSDLNIWGNYNIPENKDSTLINIYYQARNLYHENMIRDVDQTKVKKIEDILILSEGALTASIENIVFWALGIMAFREREYETAIKRFEGMKNLKEEEHQVKQWCAIAECLLAVEAYERALNYYDRILKVEEDNAIALNNKASILLKLGRDGAESLLAFAHKKYPNNEVIAGNFDALQRRKGQEEDVITPLKREEVDIDNIYLIPEVPKGDSLLVSNYPNSADSTNLKIGTMDYSIPSVGDTIASSMAPHPIYSNGLAKVRLDYLYYYIYQYGYMNEQRVLVIPIQYSYADNFNKGLAIVSKEKDHFELIDVKGNTVYSLPNGRISSFDEKYYLLVENNKKGLLDRFARLIIPLEQEEVIKFNRHYFKVKNDKGWGLVDSVGKTIIGNYFDQIDLFDNRFYRVQMGDQIGLHDLSGAPAIQCQYEDLRAAGELLIAKKGGYYGLIDFNEQIITPHKYKIIEYLDENRFVVYNEKYRCALVDQEDKAIIPFSKKLLRIEQLDHQYYKVGNRNGCGLADLAGELIIPMLYDDISIFEPELLFVRTSKGAGLVDLNNRVVVPLFYEKIARLSKDTYLTQDKSMKYGIVNSTGKVLLKNEYLNIELIGSESVIVSERYYLPKIGSELPKFIVRQGLFNLKGKKILPTVFNSLKPLKYNLLEAKEGKGYGLFDFEGNQILSTGYEDLDFNYLKYDLIVVNKKGKFGLFDIKGKAILPISYEELRPISKELSIFKEQDRYGIINARKNIVLPPIYHHIGTFRYNLAQVRLDDHYSCRRSIHIEGVCLRILSN
ncbi:MAG: WG repeat-containing protein [Bacteroidota bacterium]